ncbi:uncharacterized protein si:ch211-217g15.3 [Lampris incognitus]|uniref:uncharacterized protein si:ch211-217g15.3 n=1 Tax=Lampris incognitus TaxID=2546036 RepID=UPI0024B4A1A7|nr:uncharacterized protein si:ch211-217g15.3 [Lampris incognitus]
MFRISLIACISLLAYGVTSMPYNSWSKMIDSALQDAIMREGVQVKLLPGERVKDQEDMDVTGYDIDPDMAIWTNAGANGKYLKAEEDMDDLYHPSIEDHLKAQVQYQDALSEDISHHLFSDNKKPEQDLDGLYHGSREELEGYLVPLVAKADVGTQVRAHSRPEKDEDELYHIDLYSRVQEEQGPKVMSGTGVRLHLQPEEDMDDLYHAQQPMPAPRHAGVPAPVQVNEPIDYSRPEEDLDELSHN